MPVEETFWNPYRMIPVTNKDRKPPITHEKFQGQSGFITCSLTNLTPLFIGGNKEFGENFLIRLSDRKQIIQGTSLKGMLRSLSEIVGGGCMLITSKRLACNNIESLCIACRMFGMIEKKRNARIHQGKVSIGDAVICTENPETERFQIILDRPKTHHEAFYVTPDTGKFDNKSRKYYFHQAKRTNSVPPVPQAIQYNAKHINAILPGHSFKFTVQFTNLDDQELSLLLYVLALEDEVNVEIKETKEKLRGPLRHKLGNAKPLGLGSCHISVEKLVFLEEPKKRFLSLKKSREIEITGDDLKNKINDMTISFKKDNSKNMQQLRKMTVWDESDERVFKYPGKGWFDNRENSQKRLKAI